MGLTPGRAGGWDSGMGEDDPTADLMADLGPVRLQGRALDRLDRADRSKRLRQRERPGVERLADDRALHSVGHQRRDGAQVLEARHLSLIHI